MTVLNKHFKQSDLFIAELTTPPHRTVFDPKDLIEKSLNITLVKEKTEDGFLLRTVLEPELTILYSVQRKRNRAEIVGEEDFPVWNQETNQEEIRTRSTRRLRQNACNVWRIYGVATSDILRAVQHCDRFSLVLDTPEFREYQEKVSQFDTTDKPIIRKEQQDPF